MASTFERHETRDNLGRQITFYLTKPVEGAKELPLITMIQGSGGNSVFKRGDNGEILIALFPLSDELLRHFTGKAYILLVEKPGVKYLDEAEHGDSTGCSEDFLREYSLTRWAEAVEAAINGAQALPYVDARKTLVMGSSEGGIVAAKCAAQNSKITHVASLYGGGPTQLYDIIELSRAGTICGVKLQGKPEARVQEVLAKWAEIQKDPTSTSKFWKGHTYRRWHSFIRESLIGNILQTSARVYAVHGSADTSSPVSGFDLLVASLLSRARDITFERIEGAEHGLQMTDKNGNSYDVLDDVYKRILNWFLP